MAQLGYTFDASEVEPSAPRGEVVPAGEYLVQIVKSGMEDAKSGNGRKLELELEILDGPHARRHLWNSLNIVNASQQAQEIAQRTLSAICHAIGVLNVSDSEQLHFKPMLAVVKVKPAEDNYPAKNQIGGYKPAADGTARVGSAPAPRPMAPTAAPAPAAPSGTKSAPPWGRRVA